jgi:hypothetical protein
VDALQVRQKTLWLTLAVLLAAGAAAAWPVYTWLEVRDAEQAYRRAGANRAEPLRELAEMSAARTDRIVLEALNGPDEQMRHLAAYAITKANRRDLAEALESAWHQESNPVTRSSMIRYWAPTAGKQAVPVLIEMLESEDPWTVYGAARGLLRLGYLPAADRLLACMDSENEALRRDAQRELHSLVRPMAALIGQELPVPETEAGHWSPEQREAFIGWCRRRLTPQLLHDWLAMRAQRPAMLGRAQYLQHEWEKRFGGFLHAPEE